MRLLTLTMTIAFLCSCSSYSLKPMEKKFIDGVICVERALLLNRISDKC